MHLHYNLSVDNLTHSFLENIKEHYPLADLEIRIKQKKTNNPHILTEQGFWDIISLFDWTDEEDNDRVLEPAVNALAASPISHIYLFADMLADKLFSLDGKVYAENIGDDAYSPDVYFSVDNFLYARCCVIANGQEMYKKVLKDPTLMPKNLTFESLLSLASKAYLKKTGKRFEYLAATPIETYFNKKAWQKTS